MILLIEILFPNSLTKSNYLGKINQITKTIRKCPVFLENEMSISKPDNSATPLVAPLSYFKVSDLNLAGGKGVNLGELSKAGFDVPSGFIVTTAAYDLLLQNSEVISQIYKIISTLHFDNPNSVEEISHRIDNLFQQISIPGPITDEILRAYLRLDNGAVAVRSSSTAEDLPEAAFAGQQDTFLNVIGEKALLDAVRACWSSLWSERAILYREHQNVDHTSVKLAVVVQKMVQADIAGVLFTANPVSGSREELIIDANPGLGEAVVGGLVTPDHIVLNKRTRQIKEKRIGRRELIVRAKKGGGTEQIRSAEGESKTLFLPSHAIRKLSQLAIDIERHYGIPQDIEWAWIQDDFKSGKFYILQSRPMTALPEPVKLSGPMRLVIPILAEMWPTRPYPLDMTTFTGAIERAVGNLLRTMIGKSAPNPDESFLEEDGVVVKLKIPQVHPSLGMLITPWVTIWRTRHYDPSRWEEDPVFVEYVEKARIIEKRDLQPLAWKQILETVYEALALIPQVMRIRERYLPKVLFRMVSLWLLLLIARRTSQFGTLVSGVRTKTTETNEALEHLAKQIRSEKTLEDLFICNEPQTLTSELKSIRAGQNFLKSLEEFLEQYGHRELTLTISQPAWKDQPEIVLAILKVLAEGESPKSESYEAWQRVRDEIIGSSILGTRFLRTLFRETLNYTRLLFQIREDTHFYATMVQPTIRHAALEFGTRLKEVGALDNLEEVFHLRLEELEAFGEVWPPTKQTIEQIRLLIVRRKAKRDSLANKPMIDPRLLTITMKKEGVLLIGTPGSPGIAKGPAKVVHDVSDFGKLRMGDVLVAPVTNPAWTPLFQRAIAVVVDTGSSASHASIVAREYGIPAVMGTMNGTEELVDGQWIEVDGSRGLVSQVEAQR